jgi:phosphate:Na+ symporter
MELVGGLGLFLLGMVVMTDGLRALAGDAIRRWLIRFTRNAYSGALSGAACTALLQSSSATTVAAVGFVAAELMSFPAALGIIFGANLGTTITGWMVALFGFKLKIGLLALPLVFIGAVMRLFGRGRLADIGMTIAGFALIFVGITTMQTAMLDVSDLLTFDRFSGDSIGNRLALVAIGAGFTIITQSSSAGVAATLTALNAGIVDFPQAAALVIGMDVGSTVTAMVAAIGVGVNARRTGLSHVMYNIMTGTAAFLLVPLYIHAWAAIAPGGLEANAEFALVGFHSLFNVLGVVAVLPFTRPFARMMERLVPGEAPSYTQSLDPASLQRSDLALDAVHASVRTILIPLLALLQNILAHRTDGGVSPAGLRTAIDETHAYLDQIHLRNEVEPDWPRLVETIHVLDHMRRLHERCTHPEELDTDSEHAQGLMMQRDVLSNCAAATAEHLRASEWTDAAACTRAAAAQIHDQKVPFRETVIRAIGAGELDVRLGTELLEATRWYRRTSKHLERITVHLSASVAQTRTTAPD